MALGALARRGVRGGGGLLLVSWSGRVEKAQEGAHRGATCTVRWAHDGSAVATGDEDGAVKVWSRGGMLRTTLAQAQVAVHGLAWGPDAEQVLFCTGGHLVLKPLQPQARQS